MLRLCLYARVVVGVSAFVCVRVYIHHNAIRISPARARVMSRTHIFYAGCRFSACAILKPNLFT